MSNIATPKLKEVVRRLLAHDAVSRKPANANDFGGYRVCEKLNGPARKLIGVGAFHSLMSRALALASAEVPSLRALQVMPDGSLGGVDELARKLDSHGLAEGEVVLVSYLLGLLVTFLGAGLTLPMLRDLWPKIDDLDL